MWFVAAAMTLFTSWLAVGPRAAEEKPPELPEMLKKFLGEDTIAILKAPTRVEVFRVKGFSDQKPKPDQETIGGFAVIAKAKDLDKQALQKLAALLLNRKTYYNEGGDGNGSMGKKCAFSPGIAYRVWKDKASVDVLICLSCDELQLQLRDDQGKAMGKPRRDYTDKVRAELVKMAKASFSEDQAIQKLKEEADKEGEQPPIDKGS